MNRALLAVLALALVLLIGLGARLALAPGAEPPPMAPRVEAEEPGRSAAELEAPGTRSIGPEDASTRRRAATTRGSTARGRVIDARTGEPVPRVRVRIRGGGLEDRPETDGEGRFEGELVFPPGPLTASFRDLIAKGPLTPIPPRFEGAWRSWREGGGEMPQWPSFETLNREVTWTGARAREPDGEHTVYVLIGPTFRFETVPALDGQRLSAILRQGSTGGGPRWPQKQVLAGKPLRVRYAREHAPLDPDGDLHLVVSAHALDGRVPHDGGWMGQAPVRGTVGVHPGVLRVPMELRVALRGRVLDDALSPIEEAEVILTVPSEKANPFLSGDGVGMTARADEQGWFLLPGVPAGRCRLTARAKQHETAVIDLDVAEGRARLPDIVLTPTPPVGSIAGTMGFAPPTGALPLVRLRSLEAPGYDRIIGPRGSERVEGALRSGSFEFEGLPAGRYELSMLTVPEMPCAPEALVVEPPAKGLRFECDASAFGARTSFRVTDSRTGLELPDFKLLIDVRGRWLPVSLNGRSGEDAWFLGAGERHRWRVEREGHLPTAGDERAFSLIEGRWEAEVALEPGWARSLMFRDSRCVADYEELFEDGLAAWAAAPVPGVIVRAGGREVARSDADGLAEIRARRAPGEIEMELEGWHVVGSKELREGRLKGYAYPVLVWMARD